MPAAAVAEAVRAGGGGAGAAAAAVALRRRQAVVASDAAVVPQRVVAAVASDAAVVPPRAVAAEVVSDAAVAPRRVAEAVALDAVAVPRAVAAAVSDAAAALRQAEAAASGAEAERQLAAGVAELRLAVRAAVGGLTAGGGPFGGALGFPSGPTSSLACATTSGAVCACDADVASCVTVRAVVASSTRRRFVMMWSLEKPGSSKKACRRTFRQVDQRLIVRPDCGGLENA